MTYGSGRNGSDSRASLAAFAMLSSVATNGSNEILTVLGRVERSISRSRTPAAWGTRLATRARQPAQVNLADVTSTTLPSAKATSSIGERSTGSELAMTCAPSSPRVVVCTTGRSM